MDFDYNLRIKVYLDEDEINYKHVELDLEEIEKFQDLTSFFLKEMKLEKKQNKYSFEIYYEKEWIRLIDLKSLYFIISNNIHLELETKIKIIENKKYDEVLFNLDGRKFIDDYLDEDRPKDKIYSIKNLEKFCAFCQQSSKDESLFLKLGPFYGPYYDKDSKENYFFHESCAMWSPNIFLDEKGFFKDIIREIKRTKKTKCDFCGNKGGGLGCSSKHCNKQYHYLCAKMKGCDFNNEKYIIYCLKHLNESKRNQNNLQTNQIILDENDDNNFSVCKVCRSGLEEEVLLLCEKCEEYTHTFCSNPFLSEIPEGDYYCFSCREE